MGRGLASKDGGVAKIPSRGVVPGWPPETPRSGNSTGSCRAEVRGRQAGLDPTIASPPRPGTHVTGLPAVSGIGIESSSSAAMSTRRRYSSSFSWVKLNLNFWTRASPTCKRVAEQGAGAVGGVTVGGGGAARVWRPALHPRLQLAARRCLGRPGPAIRAGAGARRAGGFWGAATACSAAFAAGRPKLRTAIPTGVASAKPAAAASTIGAPDWLGLVGGCLTAIGNPNSICSA